jgi:hypothetical protein
MSSNKIVNACFGTLLALLVVQAGIYAWKQMPNSFTCDVKVKS